MAAADSFVGDGLAPSPYKEALARAERAEAERDELRALLQECYDRFVDAYGTEGRFTRKVGAAIAADAVARTEGE